jgi:hypothetical protein
MDVLSPHRSMQGDRLKIESGNTLNGEEIVISVYNYCG